MEIKDLECKVELGSEMSEVRGGLYYRRPYLPGLKFDLDIAKIGNQDVVQQSNNTSWATFGNVNANTRVHAPKSIGFSSGPIGSQVSYSPTFTLNQGSSLSVAKSDNITATV